ncbi:MAG: ABC transporter ATP-binding protein [Rhizobiales bacterium]|nr:ABC transporter ATP-binding protein [Hyphomicrobiales bacterium]OJU38470.1 MAG: high-affinity branched-chain amino acid ABC transporter ATP-binding protein LivG [Rhizobiales bacterium 68-8]
MTSPVASIRDVAMRFGGILALDGVSFDIGPEQIVGLIGPNGAGKTTLFNCLSRLYTPTSGDILLHGRSLLGRPAYSIAALGIGRTFQNLALFPKLSVADNIKVGGHAEIAGDFISDALRLPRARAGARELDRRVGAIVDELELGALAQRLVGDLPFGTQKRVELARALATNPSLLLLDEPAAGLNHEEVDELGGVIRRIRDGRRISILLVEHHMGLVMSLSDHVVALNFGRKIAEGTPLKVQADEAVAAAYLGGTAQ